LSARTKLNAAFIQGAILVAALIGWTCQSLTAFLLSAAVLIALATYAGDIRSGPRKR
jgi:hypothetical protein